MTVTLPAAPRRFRRPLPPWRALWLARRNMVAVWSDGAFAADFMVQRYLFRWLFVANSPEAVRHVMVSNAANYRKSRAMQRALAPLIGNGMFISHGETWARQRRLALPAFHHTRIRDFSRTMVATAQEWLDRWAHLPEGAEVEMAQAMTELTATVVSRTMFSDDLGDRASVVYEGFSRYQETLRQIDFAEMLGMPSWLPRLPSRRARKAVERIDSVIEPILARRQAEGGDRGDLLSLLLAARDEDGTPLSAKEVRDEMSVIFLAGHETTANALTWSWYLLSQHPEAEARLHEEVDRVLGGRPPAYEDLPGLTYTRWVFDEALRLYPPIAVFAREAQADDEIAGHPVKAGSMVVISPWLLHRHKALWRQPDAFDPERFSPERSARRPKYAYLPFGAGPRTCLGAAFAITEAVLILASIAQRYRLRLAPGHTVEPLCRLTLRPGDGMPMRLERR